jgi:hypothetical protein
MTKIRKEYIRLQYEIADEDSRYERKIQRINKKISELRSKCPHKRTTFHGDPAGGFDSFSECCDCGKHI